MGEHARGVTRVRGEGIGGDIRTNAGGYSDAKGACRNVRHKHVTGNISTRLGTWRHLAEYCLNVVI